MADDDLEPGTGASSPEPAAGADVTPPPSAPPSIRDSLREAIRESADAEPEKSPRRSADGRERGPDGKFLPKAADAAESAPAKTEIPSAETTAQPPASETGGPPATWAADKKSAWNDLASLQQAVIKREEEFASGIRQYQQRQNELEQVLAPRRQYHEGVTDAQAINNLWLWFEALKNSPQESFPALAKTFGYDLSTVVPGGAGQSTTEEFTDPMLTPLQKELAEVRQAVTGLTDWQRQQAETANREVMARAQANLDRLRDEKGADGKPVRPHWDQVKVSMGRLMQVGQAKTPEEAYTLAIRLDPALYEQALTEARTKAVLQPNPDAARRAAVSPRSGAPNGAAGGVRTAADPKNLRGTLVEAFREHRE